MNSIELQETIATVHFLDINFDGLKATIIEHCSIWQQKLTALLLRMTDAMVDHVYHYIAENSTKLVARMDCYKAKRRLCSELEKNAIWKDDYGKKNLYLRDFYSYIFRQQFFCRNNKRDLNHIKLFL